MKRNGYYGIGIINGKNSFNYWTLFRTAQIFNADFLFTIGERFKRGNPDTMNSYKHIPVFSYKDFNDFNSHRPFSCHLIGIEITDKAKDLSNFNHPQQACYLLGAEDHGLTQEAISHCQQIIKLPGERSLNVSVAGSIVIYDRLNKLNGG